MPETSRRMLIVEDEAIIAASLKLELRRAGIDVVGTASSATRALAVVGSAQPDTLLMDIHIVGDCDGIELARQIRTARPVDIIFMTGYSDEAVLARANSLNPIAVLHKPVRSAQILELLDVTDPSP